MAKHIFITFLFLFILGNFVVTKNVMALVMDNVEKLDGKTKITKADNNVKTTGNQDHANGQKEKAKPQNGVISGEKPANIPDFPSDETEIEVQTLFDDGFSNYVDPMFQSGEKWDIFVDQIASNEINRRYKTGNDEVVTQMDAIEAEKNTSSDDDGIDKDQIATSRTRIMAYLTLEQMLFADMFGVAPHGYYVNVVSKFDDESIENNKNKNQNK